MSWRESVLLAIASLPVVGAIAIRLVAAARYARRTGEAFNEGLFFGWWRETLGLPVRLLVPLWIVFWLTVFIIVAGLTG